MPLLSMPSAFAVADYIFAATKLQWRCNYNIRLHMLLAGGHPRTLINHLADLREVRVDVLSHRA